MKVDDIHSENVKIAIAKFLALEGDTFNEKMKYLSSYVENLNLSIPELDEFASYLHRDNMCVLHLNVLLHFKMYQHILDILKSGKGPLVGRILKDWTFFKSIFTYVTPEDLVNEVLPQLSFAIRMKVINRVCKTLSDESIANKLFELLEDSYGITTGLVILPACSIGLIKLKLVKYDIKLSERHLWTIYKKDTTFVEYYFAYLVNSMKLNKHVISDYKQLLKRILDTNSTLFWKLFENYNTGLKVGKFASKRLLNNPDILLKYAAKDNITLTFTKRQTYQAAVKLGIQNDYLLTFYPNNADDFLTKKLNIVPSLQKFVPQIQRFTLTNSLFKEKYSDDLLHYPEHFKEGYLLDCLTVSERETMLDNMKNNEDLLHYYSTEKSVPMLKEKLQSASDLKVRSKLIMMLFKTCNINNSEDNLLDLLNLLYNRYRNDTQILTQFLNTELTTWKKYEKLKSAHWDVINKILNYLKHSNKDIVWFSAKNTYFEEYFKYLVDNNKSTDEFLQIFVNEGLEDTHMQNHSFNGAAKYAKIFYERTIQLLRLQSEHGNYKSVCINFLQNIIEFDRKNPNLLHLADYIYILDFCDDAHTWYDGIFVYILNQLGVFHKNMEKYYNLDSHNFTPAFYTYCINKSPKDLLKIEDVYSKISRLDNNILDLFKCPYLTNSLNAFKDSALTELNSDKKHFNRDFSMKFVCLLDENEFVNYAERFDPPEDGKISADFDTTKLDIQKSIIKCLPWMSCPQNMTVLLKYCKGDYLKFALPSLYKILFRAPSIYVEDFLRNFYNSAVSVRKHSLFIGRHLLPPKSFGSFLEIVFKQEKNLSMQFVFLKGAREYFIEMRDDRFYHFFMASLDKIDDKDQSIYDYLINYDKIPKSYLQDYIQQICRKLSVNSDKDIKKKMLIVLNSLPDYVVQGFDTAFISWCFEEHFFEITPFAIKCLFYSQYKDIYELILEKFRSHLSEDIRSQDCANISGFVQQFCGKAIEEKAVDKFTMFYASCQHAFPEHCLIHDRFLIDFVHKWFGSKGDVKQFALMVNKYLIDTVKLYTNSFISVYCEELKSFMEKVTIDEFEFIQHFFYTNSLDETCIATINLLPCRMPSVKNSYHMYVPLLEALQKMKTTVVMAHLDLYYRTAH